jgi:GAF domain-containing protein
VSSGSDTEDALGVLAAEHAALRRVATLVASMPAPERVFHAVAEEAGRLLGARTAATVRFAEQGGVVVGEWDEQDAAGFEVGVLVPYSDPDVPVYHASQHGGRVDDYTDVPGEAARMTREAGYLSSVVAPIVAAGRTWGALFVFSTQPRHFGPDAERRLADFTELVALSLQLRLAQRAMRGEPERAEELLAAAADELEHALEELRELARGLHPAVLADRGLEAALQSLADRAPFPVEVDGVPSERFDEALEAAVYFVVAESLTNAAKYAQASGTRVEMSTTNDVVTVSVRDDGRGGASLEAGTGLRGLADRVEALGGRLDVRSPVGAGTEVRTQLPLHRARRPTVQQDLPR